jgi:hypothetical protein
MLCSKRSLLIVAALSVTFGVYPRFAAADPIHLHCDIKEWTFTFDNVSSQNIELSDFPASSVFILSVGFNGATNTPLLLPVVPPISGMPNCAYETSDITSINLTLNLGTVSSITASRIGAATYTGAGQNFGPAFDSADASPNSITFQNGKPSTMTFIPHTVGNALHVDFSKPAYTDVFLGDIPYVNGGPVLPTSATLTFSGHHYYVSTVPEPGSLVMASTAAVISLVWWWSRRRAATVA